MTLSYATTDGTATTADSDYTGTSSGSLTIAANTASASFTVATGNDSKDEANETFTVTLSGAPAGVDITRATATGTITDNDDPPPQTPEVRITGGSAITEGGTAMFTLNATPAPPASITVNVNVGQTGSFAQSGQTGAKQVTLGTSGTASFTVSTQDDETDEANGSITATVGTGTG